MLTCIGAGSAGSTDNFDYAKAYAHSPLATDCTKKIDIMNEKKINISDQNLTKVNLKL